MLSDIGVDLSSDWEFIDGDLVLVEAEDNLVQSIVNRLNTRLDSLNIFYGEYGSALHYLLGGKRSQELLDFIRIELRLVLQQDPRLNDAEVTVEFGESKEIIAGISKTFDDDTDLSLSLVITEDNGVVISGD